MVLNSGKYCPIFGFSFSLAAVLWVIPFPLRNYADTSFPYIPYEDIPFELIRLQGRGGVERGNSSQPALEDKEGRRYCQVFPHELKGIDRRIHQWLEGANTSEFLATSQRLARDLNIKPGGVWQPQECQALYESVIVIPYRGRPRQLSLFLQYIHPFLQRQQLHYRVVVVEQRDERPFNRGRLLNIGFEEVRKLGPPNICFIFHDVDLLPENDRNIYACTHQPRHMYAAVDVFRYHLPYRSLSGGAFSILARHFEEVNGFSNAFEGWGGEDDDFSSRLRRKGLQFTRFDPLVARYVMMPHRREVPSPNRFRKLASKEKEDVRRDGLTTLQYKLLKIDLQPLHTHLFVQ